MNNNFKKKVRLKLRSGIDINQLIYYSLNLLNFIKNLY